VAAAAFLGGQSRLKAGCGQNCPPSNCKLTHYPRFVRIGATKHSEEGGVEHPF
jgi:hypothetical protein